jgi:hypothetical protein
LRPAKAFSCSRYAIALVRIVAQRREYLAQPLALLVHVCPYDRDPAAIPVLIAQLEDPLLFIGMLLFGRPPLILLQNPLDDPNKRIRRAGGRLRRYPGGTENTSIFATVRRLSPSTCSARRTSAYSSTPFILRPQPVCVQFQFRQELGSEISRCNLAARI